ncbi:polycystin-1-like [Lingula anatina]|uniref:Polycystin-1-like n=1 Tax=Lingula anatina TaxID=7574 RepID=A0A1S3IC84_LINAN|nr:polycystin-1-like [Lingula anatina]|eukprot:XP_013395471.1 polycystin-1-like [Lingula anatina]
MLKVNNEKRLQIMKTHVLRRLNISNDGSTGKDWKVFLWVWVLTFTFVCAYITPVVSALCTPCPDTCKCNVTPGRQCDIDCSFAGLTTLSSALEFPSTEVIFRIDLSNNPWHCDCHLLWLKKWLDSLSVITVHNLAGIKCFSPDKLDKKLLTQVKDEEFICEAIRKKRATCAPSPNPDQFTGNCGNSDFLSCLLNSTSSVTDLVHFTSLDSIIDQPVTIGCEIHCYDQGATHWTVVNTDQCLCGHLTTLSGCLCPDLIHSPEPNSGDNFCSKLYVGGTKQVLLYIVVDIAGERALSLQDDVAFTVKTNISQVVEYQWHFGDSSDIFVSQNTTLWHYYLVPGHYNVTVTLVTAGSDVTAWTMVEVFDTIRDTFLTCPAAATAASDIDIRLTVGRGSHVGVTWSRDGTDLGITSTSAATYVIGTAVFEDVVSQVQVLSGTTKQVTMLPKTVTIFPGYWFQSNGKLRNWEFYVERVTMATRLHLQVYRPSCPTGQTLIPAGCDTPYAACVVSPPSCTSQASSNFSVGTQYCPLSQTCKPAMEPCSCITVSGVASCTGSHNIGKRAAGDAGVQKLREKRSSYRELYRDILLNKLWASKQNTSIVGTTVRYASSNVDIFSAKINPSISSHTHLSSIHSSYERRHRRAAASPPSFRFHGDQPFYKLIGETVLALNPGSKGHFQVAAQSLEVKSGDVLGFEHDYSISLIKSETETSSIWQQSSLSVAGQSVEWTNINGAPQHFRTNAEWKDGHVSFVRAMYEELAIHQAPVVLRKASNFSGGMQSVGVSLRNGLSSINHSCIIDIQENIVNFRLVQPLHSQQGISLNSNGTVVVERNAPNYYLFKVDAGSNITANWSIDGILSSFGSHCPSALSSHVDCIASSGTQSFTARQLSFSTPTRIKVTAKNSISSHVYSVDIEVEDKVQGLQVSRQNTRDVVPNVTEVFEAQITTGSSVSYIWTIDGIGVVGTGQSVQLKFSSFGAQVIHVNASNQISWMNQSYTVDIFIHAEPKNLVFQAAPTLAATGDNVTFICEVTVNAYTNFSVMWDLGSGNRSEVSFSSNSAIAMYPSVSYLFPVSGNFTVIVYISDGLKTVSATHNIEVIDRLTGLDIATPSYVYLVNDPVSVSVTPMGNLQNVQYNFTFGTQPTISTSSNTASTTFSVKGTYNITVTAYNGVSFVTGSVKVGIQEPVKGLWLGSNSPTLLGDTTVISATVISGSNPTFEFQLPDGSPPSVSQNSTFSHQFSTLGSYSVFVNVSNDVSWERSNITVYVIGGNSLQIVEIETSPSCVVPPGSVNITANIVHHSPIDLFYHWDFGDGNHVNGIGFLNTNHSYNAPGSYVVTLNVTSNFTNVSRSWAVCVQDPIQSVILKAEGPFSLGALGTAEANISVTVTGGFGQRFIWKYDRKVVESPSSEWYVVNFDKPGIHKIHLRVFNEINEKIATVDVKVLEPVSGLRVVQTGPSSNHLTMHQQYEFTAMLQQGTDITFTWDFNDIRPVPLLRGRAMNHTFSIPGVFNATVMAENQVSRAVAWIQVYIQDKIAGLTVVSKPVYRMVQIGAKLELSASVTQGTDVQYKWQYCDLCQEIESHQLNKIVYSYNLSGVYTVNVTAYNYVSSESKLLTVGVFESLTSVSINSTLKDGKYAGVGDNVTFYANSSPVKIGVVFTWTVRKAGTTLGQHTGDVLTFMFTSIGQYQVTCAGQGHLNSKEADLMVEVFTHFSGLKIVPHFLAVKYMHRATFQAEFTTGGSSVQYAWYLQDNTTTIPLPFDTTSRMSRVCSQLGHFTIQVHVSSPLESAIANATLIVQIPINGISIETSPPMPYFSLGQTVRFTVRVTNSHAGTVKYYVQLTDYSPSKVFTVPEIQHTFNKLGTFEFRVNASNEINTFDRTVKVYVRQPISGLAVSSDKQYAAVGEAISFHSTVISGTEVKYSWDFGDGSHLSTVPSSVTYSFKSPGNFVVMTTADNVISKQSENVSLIIQERIGGIEILECCVNAFPVGKQTTFKGSTNTGTDMLFRWTLGKLSDPIVHIGAEVTHMFPDPGEYFIKLEAWNYISSKSISSTIEAEVPVEDLKLVPRDSLSYVYLNVTLHFVATVVRGSNVKYRWSLNDTMDVTYDQTSFNKTFFNPGIYMLVIHAYNNVSSLTDAVEFEVHAIKCDPPVLQVVGSGNVTSLKSRKLYMEVELDTLGCTSYEVEFKWMFFSEPSCNSSLVTPVSLPSSIVTDVSSLGLPPKSLMYGHYCVRITASYKDTSLFSQGFIELDIVPSTPIAIIMGGTERLAPTTEDYYLNAFLSYDPDFPRSAQPPMTFYWECTMKSALPGAASLGCFSSQTSKSLTIPSNTLVPDETYLFTLTITSAGRTGTATQEVKTVGGPIPLASIECFSCSVSGTDQISSNSHVAMLGNCTNCAQGEAIEYGWNVTREDGQQVSLDESTTTTGANKPNLVIRRGVLQNSQAHTFHLQLKSSNNMTTYANLKLKPNQPPRPGKCGISPNVATALEEKVNVTCTGWIDPDGVVQNLVYSIFAENYEMNTERYRLYRGVKPFQEIVLSSWPGSALRRNEVRLLVYVEDDNGGRTCGLNSTVTINEAPLINKTKSEYLLETSKDILPRLTTVRNQDSLLQYIIALTMQVNKESQDAEQHGTIATELTVRSKVRDEIATAISNLPLNTVKDAQDVAFSLQQLTVYLDEFQSKQCQRLIVQTLERLDQVLQSSVTQGMDSDEFAITSLLTTLSNVIEAANLAVYYPDKVPVLTPIEQTVGNGSKGLPNIGAQKGASSYTEETHREYVVGRALKQTENLVAVVLRTQVLNEKEVTLAVGDMKIAGRRTVATDIWQERSTYGINFVLPDNLLGDLQANDEVLQIMFVMPKNPFTWGYVRPMNVTSRVPGLAFKYPDGRDITVNNLMPHRRLKVLMFGSSNLNSSAVVFDGRLVGSAAYDPLQDMKYVRRSVLAEDGVKVVLNTTGIKDTAAALHVQIRFTVRPNMTAPDNSENDVFLDAFLGKNYEPTASKYEEKLKVSWEDMAKGKDHRKYTIFVEASYFNPNASYQLVLENRGVHHAVNVAIGLYVTSCQFYNELNNTWDTGGCEPDAESVAACSVCLCNHLTSFGASVLVTPNAIKFQDLARLDIRENPVALITVCVVGAVYILCVILARRWDLADFMKVSVVPLCGRDGVYRYEIVVITGRQRGAGTSAHVGVRLYGENAKSEPQHLNQVGAFQRNSRDVFIIASDINLGDIYKLRIWHDNTSLNPAWFVSRVVVRDLQTNQKYQFILDCWLSLEAEEPTIEKEVLVANAEELNNFSTIFGSEASKGWSQRHLWLSTFERPTGTSFTRVQRVTSCVTFLYTFMCVNAMWYGLLKTDYIDVDLNFEMVFGFEYFSWEEIVVGVVSSVIVFPVNLVLIQMFASSRHKLTRLDKKPQTAQTIEIEAMCEMDSQGGSLLEKKGRIAPPDILQLGDRESTVDSAQAIGPLRRTNGQFRLKREVSVDDSWRDTDSGSGIYSNRDDSSVRSNCNHDKMWASYEGIMSWPDGIPGDHVTSGGSLRGKPSYMPLEKLKEEPEETEENEVDKNILKRTRPVQRNSSNRLPPRDEAQLPESESRPGAPTPATIHRKSWDQITWPSARSRSSSLKKQSSIETFESSSFGQSLRSHAIRSLGRSMSTPYIPALPSGRTCRLPHCCIYLAYLLCFALSGLSILVILLYGHKFGRDVALRWLISLAFSFVQSAFITEPLKVVFIALFLAAISKKHDPTEEGNLEVLPTIETNEKIKDVKFKPVSGFALIQAQEEAQKKKRIHVLIRQTVVYFIFIWLVLVINYANHDQMAYHMTRVLDVAFVKASFGSARESFSNITSVETFWQWADTVLAPSLQGINLYEEEFEGHLIGNVQMVQVRNKQATCEIRQVFPALHLSTFPPGGCYRDGSWAEDMVDYREEWKQKSKNGTNWKYFLADEIDSLPLMGRLQWYHGGGYVQTLQHGDNKTLNDTLTQTQCLRDHSWLDERTRAVVVYFTVYNANLNLYSSATLLVEFPLPGKVLFYKFLELLPGSAVTSHWISTHKLQVFSADHIDPVLIIQCLMGAVLLYLIIHTAVTLKQQGCSYFTWFWNLYEVAVILTTSAALAMYAYSLYFNTGVVDQSNQKFDVGLKIHRASFYNCVLTDLSAFLLFLLCLKLTRQFRFVKSMAVYGKTLNEAATYIMGCFILLVIFLISYAALGYLFFGTTMSEFCSFSTSLLTLLASIRGHNNLDHLYQHQPYFTAIFFISFNVVAHGVIGGLVMATVLNIFKGVRAQIFYRNTLDVQDYELVDFMLKRFKLLIGITKPKPAFRKVKFQGMLSISSRSTHSSYSCRPISHESGSSWDWLTEGNLDREASTISKASIGTMDRTWGQLLSKFEQVVTLDKDEAELDRQVAQQLSKPRARRDSFKNNDNTKQQQQQQQVFMGARQVSELSRKSEISKKSNWSAMSATSWLIKNRQHPKEKSLPGTSQRDNNFSEVRKYEYSRGNTSGSLPARYNKSTTPPQGVSITPPISATERGMLGRRSRRPSSDQGVRGGDVAPPKQSRRHVYGKPAW